ncbi:MAG: NAD(P)H-binding protein [Acetobacteraceae bacterium]
MARRLLGRGWTVRALNRNPDRLSEAEKTSGIRWLRGDAMSAADVSAAAAGASVIVHAVNPPGLSPLGRTGAADARQHDRCRPRRRRAHRAARHRL